MKENEEKAIKNHQGKEKSWKFPLSVFYENGRFSKYFQQGELPLGVKIKSFVVLFDVEERTLTEAEELQGQILDFGAKKYQLILPNEKQALAIAQNLSQINACIEMINRADSCTYEKIQDFMFWLDSKRAANDYAYAFNPNTCGKKPVFIGNHLQTVFLVKEIKVKRFIEES